MSKARVLDFPERFNAADFFVDRAVREYGWGTRAAFRYRGQSVTFAHTADMVAHAAGALLEAGVRAEQRVLLVLPDSPDFTAAFFGAIKAGIVPVPVHTLIGPDDLRYYLNDSGAAALIVHQDFVEKLTHVLPPLTIVAGDGSDFERRLRGATPLREAAPTHPDDMAFWLYTSGSTGRPKGAVHLQRDMVYGADLYAIPTQRLTPDDRIFSASKMFFAYGLGNTLYCPLRAGACAILAPERSTPEMCLRTIEKERPTVFYAVPTLYAAILNHAESARQYDTSSLRLAVSAGEALPAEIFRRFQDRFGVEILDGIGSTEMVHVFISNRPGDCRPGSSGRLVDGYDARIVDDEGHDVAPGETGNLLISGCSAAAFYWRKAAQTRATMLGEWLRTGDKYRQDADGYYWYCGRSDDMLRVGAQWVSPVEVEGALLEHPAVLECAVASVVGPDGLAHPRAFVVLRGGVEASPELGEEMRAFLRGRVAHHKVPRDVEFVRELAKTATGKIQRFKLRERQP
jgi:benzoate-CoA ligase family protein